MVTSLKDVRILRVAFCEWQYQGQHARTSQATAVAVTSIYTEIRSDVNGWSDTAQFAESRGNSFSRRQRRLYSLELVPREKYASKLFSCF